MSMEIWTLLEQIGRDRRKSKDSCGLMKEQYLEIKMGE